MDEVLERIVEIIQRHNLKKAVLFGSRARGDHSEVSDYDIAVFADTLSEFEQAAISDKIDEIPTLKKIQVVFMCDSGTDELLENINREGVILYEQV